MTLIEAVILGIVQGAGECRVLGLVPRLGSQPYDGCGAEADEQLVVGVEDLRAERGRGRDHRDPGALSARSPDEVAQDDPPAHPVLGAPDGEQRAPGQGGEASGWHARSLMGPERARWWP